MAEIRDESHAIPRYSIVDHSAVHGYQTATEAAATGLRARSAPKHSLETTAEASARQVLIFLQTTIERRPVRTTEIKQEKPGAKIIPVGADQPSLWQAVKDNVNEDVDEVRIEFELPNLSASGVRRQEEILTGTAISVGGLVLSQFSETVIIAAVKTDTGSKTILDSVKLKAEAETETEAAPTSLVEKTLMDKMIDRFHDDTMRTPGSISAQQRSSGEVGLT